MNASESRTPTLRGYDAGRRPLAADPRQRVLGPYERSYELRRGYEAPPARRDADRGGADASAPGR